MHVSPSAFVRTAIVVCSALAMSAAMFSQTQPPQSSIQLFSEVNLRASATGTGYGAAAVDFNSNTLNLTCPASGISAILSSTADSNGKLLVDNNINVTVAQGATTVGPTNICVGGVNGSSIGIPFQNCFNSAYEFPPAGVSYLGQNPDTFVAVGGVAPIDISSLLVPGASQVTIALQDEGFFLANTTLFLNTNCTQTGVTGPALVTGNPISQSNPTPDQLSQDFSFNPTTGQAIGFEYDLTAALAAGSLTITDGTIPQVGDQPLDPAIYQSTYTPGTSFATSSCIIHSGESLANGNPACKLYTLECTVGTGANATGAQCPVSTIANEIFSDNFDGPAFSLQDIATPSGVTFHQGIGLLMAKEGWMGGPCTFDPATGLQGENCPQNLLTNFSSTTVTQQTQVAAPVAHARVVAVKAQVTANATSSATTSYTSGGRTTRPNSTFVTVSGVPEDLTTVTVAGQQAGGWINTPTAKVTLSSVPPSLAGTSLPGAAGFVPSPIHTITYGISSAASLPSPGDLITTDTTVTNSAGCPSPAAPGNPAAGPFGTGVVTLPNLANGRYLLHYYAQDCAGTEELKFTQDANSNWSTSFYTAPLNVDTVAPPAPSLTLTPPSASGTYPLGQPLSASYECTDALSGIVKCGTQTYGLDATGTGVADTGALTANLSTLSPGVKSFSVTAADAAGNQTTSTVNYTVTGSFDSQIQISLSPAAVTFPSGSTVTVKLLPGSNPTKAPTGTVQLLDGTNLVANLTLSGAGSGTAAAYQFQSGLAAGAHVFTVKYAGDALNPAGVSNPVTLNVAAAPVTLSASCVNPSLPSGANFSCNIYTKPVLAGNPGKATYTYDNGAPITLNMTNGTAAFSITKPTVGAHTVVISFAAQGNYLAAPSQTVHFTVVAPK